jgi:hypothetical protein
LGYLITTIGIISLFEIRNYVFNSLNSKYTDQQVQQDNTKGMTIGYKLKKLPFGGQLF